MIIAICKMLFAIGPVIGGPEVGTYYLGNKGWHLGYFGGAIFTVLLALYFLKTL